MSKPEGTQRQTYTQWAKERALAELEAGSFENAIASMISDLSKDPKRDPGQMQVLAMLSMSFLQERDLTKEKVKKFINDFGDNGSIME